jgi:hypothetical protein
MVMEGLANRPFSQGWGGSNKVEHADSVIKQAAAAPRRHARCKADMFNNFTCCPHCP